MGNKGNQTVIFTNNTSVKSMGGEERGGEREGERKTGRKRKKAGRQEGRSKPLWKYSGIYEQENI